jgi:hypothetical protein
VSAVEVPESVGDVHALGAAEGMGFRLVDGLGCVHDVACLFQLVEAAV